MRSLSGFANLAQGLAQSLTIAFLVASLWAPQRAAAAPVDAEPLNMPDSLQNMRSDEPLAAPNAAPAADAPAPAPTQPLPDTATDFDPANLPNPASVIVMIPFDGDASTLSPQATDAVKSFAYSFKERGGRVALKGYAGSPGSTGSNERRLSLRRVLAVREILLSEGIKADRLDVRALGGVRDNGPADRVDITKSGR